MNGNVNMFKVGGEEKKSVGTGGYYLPEDQCFLKERLLKRSSHQRKQRSGTGD